MNKNKHGVILDDFAFEAMLDRFMCDFIRPISQGYFFIFLIENELENYDWDEETNI